MTLITGKEGRGTGFSGLEGKDRAREMVKSRYIVSEAAQSSRFVDYDKFFRMYKNERVEANYRGTSDIVVPKVFEKVERGTAVISRAIKRVRILWQENADKEAATLNEKLIEYEDRVLQIPRIRKQWIKAARIYGQAYLKATWNVVKEEPDRPWKGIDISLPDPRNIYFNPDHAPDKPFRWAIHEMEIPYDVVAQDPGLSKQQKEDIRELSVLGGKKGNKRKARTAGRRRGDDVDTTTLMVSVKEYYGPFAQNDNAPEEQYFISLMNDEVVAKMEKSVYAEILDDPIPIIPLYTYVIPHESHAMGDAEAIKSLYIELNDTRNQRMDTVTLNIDPAKEVIRAAQIDESDLVAKKGWVIHSNIPNGVKFIPPDMQGVVAAINEEKIIHGDIDRTLGIPSFGAETPVQGDQTSDTATGVRALLGAQDIISNSVLEEVKVAFTQLYRNILAFNQAFIDREFKITLLEGDTTKTDQGPEGPQGLAQGGQDEVTISPERIKGNHDVDVEVELESDKAIRSAEALAALQIASKIPGSNIGKFIEEWLRTKDKYNVEEYWQQPQPQPDPPKVSVSLRGEMGGVQASQVYKTIPGVNQKFADPLMSEEGRDIARGSSPEQERRKTERGNNE